MGGYPPYSDPRTCATWPAGRERPPAAGMKIVPYTAPAGDPPRGAGLQQGHPPVAAAGGSRRRNGLPFHGVLSRRGAGRLVCPWAPGYAGLLPGLREEVRAEPQFRRHLRGPGLERRTVTTRGTARITAASTGCGSSLEAREFLGPDKIIVGHNGNSNMMVTLNNLSDAVVTMEMFNGPKVWNWDLDIVHSYIRAFPACPVLMIPDYRWFWTTTKRGCGWQGAARRHRQERAAGFGPVPPGPVLRPVEVGLSRRRGERPLPAQPVRSSAGSSR